MKVSTRDVAVTVLSLIALSSQAQAFRFDMPLRRMVQAARLFGCQLNGYDQGIIKAYQDTVSGYSDNLGTQLCVMGCMISWMHSVQFVFRYETGKPMLPHYQPLRFLRDCIDDAIAENNKCNIVPSIAKCLTKQIVCNGANRITGVMDDVFQAIRNMGLEAKGNHTNLPLPPRPLGTYANSTGKNGSHN